MSCRAGLVASAFVFGLFLNGSGQFQPVEAFNIKIKQPNPIQHMYFNGYTKPSGHGRAIPFVARLTYDIRAKNVKQGRTRAYGEYAIKEFVFTTKYQYSRVPGGSIKIYNNSLNRKDAIQIAAGGFYMTLYCGGNYITSLSLPRGMKDRACWAHTINFKRFTSTKLRSVSGSKMALLRTPSGQPPAQNPSPPKTNKLVVCIKAYNNRHYVVSESNKKTVNANRPHCKAWERHTIIDLNGGRLQHGDRVAVRTHWKRYWSAQPNGRHNLMVGLKPTAQNCWVGRNSLFAREAAPAVA